MLLLVLVLVVVLLVLLVMLVKDHREAGGPGGDRVAIMIVPQDLGNFYPELIRHVSMLIVHSGLQPLRLIGQICSAGSVSVDTRRDRLDTLRDNSPESSRRVYVTTHCDKITARETQGQTDTARRTHD